MGNDRRPNAAALLGRSPACQQLCRSQPRRVFLRNGQGNRRSDQVGFASNVPGQTQIHAIYWSGSAASYVDLNPAAGFTNTYAQGIEGSTITGWGSGTATNNRDHALIWTGPLFTMTDINPPGYASSSTNQISGGKEIGTGTTSALALPCPALEQLMLGVVNLTPAGYTESITDRHLQRPGGRQHLQKQFHGRSRRDLEWLR